MRKAGILNSEICDAISSLRHTDYMVIADPGLPIPNHVRVIDIALREGTPGFMEVLEAIHNELVVDSYIYAEEMEEKSTELFESIKNLLIGIPNQKISHEKLKRLLEKTKVVIRTGECTPYANIILEGGVSF